MTAATVAAIALALLAGLAAGLGIATLRSRSRLKRVSEGLHELARGNLSHRVILPGGDDAALLAEGLNRLADAIQQEREVAAAKDEARRRLLTNISHDLRTPITSIAGYVDALQRGLGDDPDRYLAVIGAKADELAQLTDDLFYATRIDAGDLELKHGRIDLAEAVRRSALGFEPEAAAKGVRVNFLLPETPRFVEADPSAVSRILSNIISNSLRHGTGTTELSIEMFDQTSEDTNRETGASSSRGEYVVRITNDGAMLPEDADRLFQRGVAGPGGGAGLGLSIARELAERTDATLTAESAPGRGVTFTLTFPRA